MLIDFLAFNAKFLLAIILWKLIEIHLVRTDPERPASQAVAFLFG